MRRKRLRAEDVLVIAMHRRDLVLPLLTDIAPSAYAGWEDEHFLVLCECSEKHAAAVVQLFIAHERMLVELGEDEGGDDADAKAVRAFAAGAPKTRELVARWREKKFLCE